MSERDLRVIHAFCRADALALRLFWTPRYSHHNSRSRRLWAFLPERVKHTVLCPWGKS